MKVGGTTIFTSLRVDVRESRHHRLRVATLQRTRGYAVARVAPPGHEPLVVASVHLSLDAAERERRAAAYHAPFHRRVEQALDRRVERGRPTIVLGIHSFTPVFFGERRPWHAGVLYGRAAGFGQALAARIGADPALCVGDNEPYQVTADTDYTVPVHGDRRGLAAALIEVRQDLIGDDAGVEEWALRLHPALAEVAHVAG